MKRVITVPSLGRILRRTTATSAAFPGLRYYGFGGPHAPGASPRGDDWMCACGFKNFGYRERCLMCNALGATSPPSRQHVAPFKNGDWNCECGTHNFARRTECLVCHRPRPARTETMIVKPGDWYCEGCLAHNFRSRSHCFKCGQEKTAACRVEEGNDAEKLRHSVPGAVCESCHAFLGTSCSVCPVCGAAVSEVNTETDVSDSTPRDAETSPRLPHDAHPGDWTCPRCNFYNFASRVKCKRCMTSKPGADSSIGDAATSSEVLQNNISGVHAGEITEQTAAAGSAPKWICSCGYQNFLGRVCCRECGTPKPPSSGDGLAS